MSKIKSEQLKMSFGKANAKLRKSILFYLVKECNLDTCYRCKRKIRKIENLSIEHKIPWLDSENPKELFFDLNNIAFSHLSCNVGNKRFRLSHEGKLNIIKASKGENHSKSKLTDIERNIIKSKLKNGEGVRKLGREYNVHHSTIQNIRGKNYD